MIMVRIEAEFDEKNLPSNRDLEDLLIGVGAEDVEVNVTSYTN